MATKFSPEKDAILPLGDCPASQTGTSVAQSKAYKAEVSNSAGYMCHIMLETQFDVPPDVVFRIFTHPNNAGVFRDIKHVGSRKVLEERPRYKRVEVEQVGELRVLWVHRHFSTFLVVEEDARDPEHMITDFQLSHSDILSKFGGRWELTPVRNQAGEVVGTRGVLNQDVLPKGMPVFLKHVPVVGSMIRRISLGTIQRLVEDLLNICNKYKKAKGSKSVEQIMAEIAADRGVVPQPSSSGAAAAEAAHQPGVHSFQVAHFTDDESEEPGDGAGAGSAQGAQSGSAGSASSGDVRAQVGVSAGGDDVKRLAGSLQAAALESRAAQG